MPKLKGRPGHRAQAQERRPNPEVEAAPHQQATTPSGTSAPTPMEPQGDAQPGSQTIRQLLGAGLVILPAKPREKRPYVLWKNYQDTRPTEDEYREWFGTRGARNYWLLCGHLSRTWVLDTDSDEAERFWREDMGLGDLMDATVRVRTTKGHHYWFRVPEGHRAPGWAYHHDGLSFDVRGEGGGVVIPPSTHPTGAKYEWVTTPDPEADNLGLVALPEQLASEAAARAYLAERGKTGALPAKPATPQIATGGSDLAELLRNPPQAEGGRNDWLAKVAGHFARREYRASGDAGQARYAEQVTQAATSLRPLLPADEVAKTAESIWQTQVRNHPEDAGAGVAAAGGGGGQGPSVATQLVELAMERYEFGVSEDGDVFARPPGRHVVRALSGDKQSMRAELSLAFYRRNGKVPGQQALADAQSVIEGQAQETDPVKVAMRVAEAEGAIWIDLGDVDERVIRIANGSWDVVPTAPVLFRRTALTGVLPVPETGGDLAHLWEQLNVSEPDRPLVLAWMAQALLQPNQPHPVLTLFGEQGTAKSTLTKRLVSLVDPSPVPLRKPPKDGEAWISAAHGSYVVGLDNLSGIPDWLSDSLCRAATGDGDVRRTLYRDKQVTLFRFLRPVILNGIDLGALKNDLLDRAVKVSLDRLPARKTDKELSTEWEAAYPQLFGAVLTYVAQVQATLPQVTVENPIRMADYHHVLVATDQVLGTQGEARHRALAETMAEDSVAAQPFLAALTERGETVVGTAKEVLTLMSPYKPEQYGLKGWPTTARYVTTLLTRSAPALRLAGWEVHQEWDAHAKVTRWHLLAPQDVAEPTLA